MKASYGLPDKSGAPRVHSAPCKTTRHHAVSTFLNPCNLKSNIPCPKKPVRPCKQLTCRALFGAPERTRTFTGEPPLEPESSASTNSATSAHGLVRTGLIMHGGGGLATIFLHMEKIFFRASASVPLRTAWKRYKGFSNPPVCSSLAPESEAPPFQACE